MGSGNDADLWSAALLESVIIPSGQSVWHSAVAFQSPPSSPLVRHSSPPPPLARSDQSEQTCLYLYLFSFVFFRGRRQSHTQSHKDHNRWTTRCVEYMYWFEFVLNFKICWLCGIAIVRKRKWLNSENVNQWCVMSLGGYNYTVSLLSKLRMWTSQYSFRGFVLGTMGLALCSSSLTNKVEVQLLFHWLCNFNFSLCAVLPSLPHSLSKHFCQFFLHKSLFCMWLDVLLCSVDCLSSLVINRNEEVVERIENKREKAGKSYHGTVTTSPQEEV